MKKLLFATALFLMAGAHAKAISLNVTNYIPCDVEINVVGLVSMGFCTDMGYGGNTTLAQGANVFFSDPGADDFEIYVIIDPAGAAVMIPALSASGVCIPVTPRKNGACGGTNIVVSGTWPNYQMDILP